MKQTLHLITLFLLLIASCCQDSSADRKKSALELISNIEKYKLEHQKLPNSSSDLGYIESEDSKAFYKKLSDSTFIVWYGNVGLESNIYNSENRQWSSK